jgi:hypothetical protein
MEAGCISLTPVSSVEAQHRAVVEAALACLEQ